MENTFDEFPYHNNAGIIRALMRSYESVLKSVKVKIAYNDFIMDFEKMKKHLD